jgi:hypothetical protein
MTPATPPERRDEERAERLKNNFLVFSPPMTARTQIDK